MPVDADSTRSLPLQGVRVIEMGQLLAGPFCTRVLAEFGAEVIKIEPPGKGDPLRVWRVIADETKTSLWWYVQSRNKKSITLDLNHTDAAALILKLVAQADVLVENFKPGAMEKWGLGYEQLRESNPGIIMTRVSGWGQSGPYRDKPGYGSIGESMGGLRYITGTSGEPPVRTGISIGDEIAGLYGAIGTLMALYNRDARGGAGQVVDVALNEAVFALMESMLPEYGYGGFIRERSGAALPGIAPSNTYPTSDGSYIVIGGNGDSIFKRLMVAIGREDLANDPAYATNKERAQHSTYLDEVIGGWTSQHTLHDAFAILDKAGVPVGPIYSIADIAADPHFRARGMIAEVDVPSLGPLTIPGIVPHLCDTPGVTLWPGPTLGQHNHDVYSDLLGLTDTDIAAMQERGLI